MERRKTASRNRCLSNSISCAASRSSITDQDTKSLSSKSGRKLLFFFSPELPRHRFVKAQTARATSRFSDDEDDYDYDDPGVGSLGTSPSVAMYMVGGDGAGERDRVLDVEDHIYDVVGDVADTFSRSELQCIIREADFDPDLAVALLLERYEEEEARVAATGDADMFDMDPSPPVKPKGKSKPKEPKPKPAVMKKEVKKDVVMKKDVVVKKEAVVTRPPHIRPAAETERILAGMEGTAHVAFSMVSVGHIDAGKSTLVGHLLYSCGMVHEQEMHRFRRDAEKAGKGSFSYAWVMDSNADERARGVTVDVGMKELRTPSGRDVLLLDAPGHRDFVTAMISGTACADTALLVVDASPGEFEKGLDGDGQTREHAILVRSLGIVQLFVAVNKMDKVNWSEERFKEISGHLGQFLRQCGFKLERVKFIPVSGLVGDNLSVRSTDEAAAWYTGPVLVELLDSFVAPPRPVALPTVLASVDLFKLQNMGGVAASARVVQGFVRAGDRLLVQPQQQCALVKSIVRQRGATGDVAVAGDRVDIVLADLDTEHISSNSVLVDPEHPLPMVRVFDAQLQVLELSTPLVGGSILVLHAHSVTAEVSLRKLHSVSYRDSRGERKNPRTLGSGCVALVTLAVRGARALCMSSIAEVKPMARFLLRLTGTTVAAGLVQRIIETAQPHV